ncbi:hypothetical protein Hte_004485 [Hypoxylon texense]
MRTLNLLLMGAGLVRCIALAPAEAGDSQLNTRADADDVDDFSAASDWDFAILDEAYDPDDPAIKDLPEIDPSKIVFTDYDTEMNGTLAARENSAAVNPRGLTHHFCGLTNYPHPTIGPIRDGIRYLHDGGNQKFCVAKKKCGRISCSYGTGFNVCNGKQKTQCYTLGGIGKRVNFLTHDKSFIARPGHASYAASKFAIETIHESLSHEVNTFGIKVLIVEPGMFRTLFSSRIISPAEYEEGDGFSDAYKGTAVEEMANESRHTTSIPEFIKRDHEKAAQAIVGAVGDGYDYLRMPSGADCVVALETKIGQL